MGCKTQACAECTQKCLLVHGKKKNPSHVVVSFFKVMLGDQFSEALFFPPKFAPTVSTLVNQKTFLEDSSGRQWKVTISNLNGSLAFHQGWNSFTLSHGLKVGDFLTFNYIIGSHFVVKIYDTTGCEKLDFAENSNQKKRARINRNSTAKDGLCHTIDESSMNKQGSSTSAVSVSVVEISRSQSEVNNMEERLKVPENTSKADNSKGPAKPVLKAEYTEEPYYMINRDLADKQGDDRSAMFDLFNFEMCNNNSGADNTNKVAARDASFPRHRDRSLRSQIETSLVDKDPVTKGVVSRVAPTDNNSGADNTNKIAARDASFPCHRDRSQRSQTDTSLVDKDPAAKGVSRVAPTDASDFEMIEKIHYSEEILKKASLSDKKSCNDKTSRNLLATSAVRLVKNEENMCDMLSRVITKCQIAEESCDTVTKDDQAAVSPELHTLHINSCQNAEQKFNGMSESLDVPITIEMQDCQSGEIAKIAKKEPVEITPDLRSHNKIIQEKWKDLKLNKGEHSRSSNMVVRDNVSVLAVVKAEPIDLVGISSPIAASVSCLATESQSFLELPTCLPCSYKVKARMERRVVVLQDSAKRLWPVLYHEKPGFRTLTSGWEAFSKANNIQPGDECIFGVESESEGIYSVRIA